MGVTGRAGDKAVIDRHHFGLSFLLSLHQASERELAGYWKLLLGKCDSVTQNAVGSAAINHWHKRAGVTPYVDAIIGNSR